ncbi:MAG: capsule assembly Wzi family protein [Muribaculaceae bacterium]|nr:capsule assembly Wzi family protein [Muribaculaceae bacterium]
MSIKNIIAILAICLFLPDAWAEKADSLRYEGEVRATFSGGDYTPFWLVNNLQGLGSPQKNNGYVRGALFKDMKPENRFTWGAGIDLVGAWRAQSPFYIHQLYGEVKYRSLQAFIGSKEMGGNFLDTRLSSGDLLYSGNALPVPQLRLGIFDYADFWGCKGWFAVKGYFAYGMFTDSKWQKSWASEVSARTENVLYHSKGLWLRGGNTDKFPLEGEIGIEMATQFGGKAFVNGEWYHMSHGIKEWIKAFFPKYTSGTFAGEDNRSVEGNMMGQYNIALAWKPKADWSIRAYYEHFFEDESQMTFEYGWKDGLYGIEVSLPKNPFVSKFVYEFLHTKDQTGPVFWNSTPEVPDQVSGRDDYYNHYLYNCWQHWGMGIGNPLVLSPIFNSDGFLHFMNNRIIAHHFGLEGNPTKEINYRLLLSFSRSWGSYDYQAPEVLNNFNGLLELTWTPDRFKGWFGKIGIAGDAGKLIGNSFGVMLSVGFRLKAQGLRR